ncbi:MAG: hypothetical protein CVU56_16595 [Deltaproteobacteria bacterium HGW-Deltaproteobacteria-14]|jgi:murein L,D-transpeptidase YcbB/YkuD|nr:MAG: hypothetical protein CVU56_16595 [Deltaproteobacteria bacterium HGW-Deltaproteobacteria-14]
MSLQPRAHVLAPALALSLAFAACACSNAAGPDAPNVVPNAAIPADPALAETIAAPEPTPTPAPPAPAPPAAPEPPPAPTAVFTTPNGTTPAGDAALRWLDDAPLHGVTLPADPTIAAWRDRPDPAQQAAAEDAIAAAAAQLAAALAPRPNTTPVLVDDDGNYLSPDTLWLDAPLPTPDPDAARAVLDAAQQGTLDDWFVGHLPSDPQYTRLVAAARQYRTLCAAGGWEPIRVPKHKRADRWKDEDGITALQRRLALEGYLSGAPTGVYDDATTAAVERYRATHALWDKPYFDEDVAEALNVPCETRLATLLLNVRRWRHTARTDQPTYVRVNLPAAVVTYVRAGEVRRVHRAVVGSGRSYFNRTLKRRIRRNATPVMHDEISNVVLNPEWKVPFRLASQEIGPAIEKDPTYAEKHGFRIVTAANGHQMYVQAHGPSNALGQIKLTFPNSESIYLHDTPSKGYFRFPKRDFSHGCVRVQDAIELGMTLVQDDFAERGESLSDYFLKKLIRENEKTYWYGLDPAIPVFIEYYTASVDDDGGVHFHPDVYDYDADSLKALAGR